MLNKKLSKGNNDKIVLRTNTLKEKASKREGKKGDKTGNGKCVTLEKFDFVTTIPSDYVAEYPDMIATDSNNINVISSSDNGNNKSVVSVKLLKQRNFDDEYNGLIAKEDIFNHFPLKKRNMANPYELSFTSKNRQKWNKEILRVIEVIKNNEGTINFYKRLSMHDIYLNQIEFNIGILQQIITNNNIEFAGGMVNKKHIMIEKIKNYFFNL